MKKTLLIAAALTTWALSPSAAQETSSVLQSLPTEVQKNIEQVRTSCREYFAGMGVDPSQSIPYVPPRVSSGDEGLNLFTLSGSQAVMVSDLHLCDDQISRASLAPTTAAPRSTFTSAPAKLEECPLNHDLWSALLKPRQQLTCEYADAFRVTARTVRGATGSFKPMALQPGSGRAMRL